MNKTPILAWEAAKKYYEEFKDSIFVDVRFNSSAKSNFIEDFKNQYNDIKTNYMDKAVVSLDRHKQAAILINCMIKNRILSSNRKLAKSELFIGSEQIALLVGLAYMKDRLNELLKETNQQPIQKYSLPEAISCDTEYFDILTRDLYLQNHKDDAVYIFSLSHILFLIEYQTLKDNGIDIEKLKKHKTQK